MDIQKASNFEINKAVAETFGYVVKDQIGKNDFVFIENPDFDLGHEGLNYCNQWEDAGPIIQDNRISIEATFYETSNTWSAHRLDHRSINQNPLRAAMEVYLMMKQGIARAGRRKC